MEPNELKNKIITILSKQEFDLENGDFGYHYINPAEPRKAIINFNYTPPLLSPNSQNYELKFETLGLLSKLFNQIENFTKLKKEFIEYLIKDILNSNGQYTAEFGNINSSYLSLATLIKLGYFDEALRALVMRRNKNDLDILSSLNFLNNFIRYEYHLITESQLTKIKDYMNKLETAYTEEASTKKEICKQLNEIAFKNLKVELQGINFHINQDKKEVIKKIEYFNFGEDLIELLNEIDQIFTNSEIKSINSGMVNNLRHFISVIIKKICEEVKKNVREEYPKEKDSEMGNLRIYLKKHLEINNKDDKLIDSFIDVLHSQGGHSFGTEKEYFRLAKNIAIELSFFLLTKLERFNEQNKPKNVK